MNKSELLDLLEKEMIPNHYFSLDGGLPYDAWCMKKTYSGWRYTTPKEEKNFKLKYLELKKKPAIESIKN